MKNKITFYSIFVLLVSGCSTVENIFTVKDPVSLSFPVKSKTMLTDRLACFGDMLSDYKRDGENTQLLTISIQSVKDATGISTEPNNHEIPYDMTDLAINIASNVGGALRVVHVPRLEELQEAQSLIEILATLGAATKETASKGTDSEETGRKITTLANLPPSLRLRSFLSQIVLYGTLTEYDRTLKNDKTSMNVGTDFGGGRGSTNLNFSHGYLKNISRMTMDFRIVFSRNGEVMNSISSSNTIWLYQSGKDYSYGLSINGNAVGNAISLTEVDARHAAIRMLIELGIIETIGKFEQLPYWKCLPGAKSDGYTKFEDVLRGEQTHENDLRDADVIFSVKRAFEYADYFSKADYTLQYQSRGNEETIIAGEPKKGKLQKTERIVRLYQRNDPQLPRETPKALDKLYERFQMEKVITSDIPSKDRYFDTNMYLALWLNVPFKSNARWTP